VATITTLMTRKPGSGQLNRLVARFSASVQQQVNRLKPNLLTIAGLGCVDVGFFEANKILGWVGAGLAILILDWKGESSE